MHTSALLCSPNVRYNKIIANYKIMSNYANQKTKTNF